MQIKLDKKQNENELIQNELSQLKEFRKRKIQMQKELEDVRYYQTNANNYLNKKSL